MIFFPGGWGACHAERLFPNQGSEQCPLQWKQACPDHWHARGFPNKDYFYEKRNGCLFDLQTVHGILEKSKFCKDMTVKYDSRLRERVSINSLLICCSSTIKYQYSNSVYPMARNQMPSCLGCEIGYYMKNRLCGRYSYSRE